MEFFRFSDIFYPPPPETDPLAIPGLIVKHQARSLAKVFPDAFPSGMAKGGIPKTPPLESKIIDFAMG